MGRFTGLTQLKIRNRTIKASSSWGGGRVGNGSHAKGKNNNNGKFTNNKANGECLQITPINKGGLQGLGKSWSTIGTQAPTGHTQAVLPSWVALGIHAIRRKGLGLRSPGLYTLGMLLGQLGCSAFLPGSNNKQVQSVCLVIFNWEGTHNTQSNCLSLGIMGMGITIKVQWAINMGLGWAVNGNHHHCHWEGQEGSRRLDTQSLPALPVSALPPLPLLPLHCPAPCPAPFPPHPLPIL